MVVLNRIYTRTGDDGTTSLGSGARRKKYDLRVAAYGTLDEVNAVIGIVRLHAADDAALDAALARIQNDLFDVEADLCLSEKGPGGARLTVTQAQVDWVEAEIDRLNAELEPLRSFVLPGGSAAAAYLHLARTICRRAERIMVELKDQPDEFLVDMAARADPFHHLLAQVATFLETHGLIESGFEQKIVLIHIHAVAGDSSLDAKDCLSLSADPA